MLSECLNLALSWLGVKECLSSRVGILKEAFWGQLTSPVLIRATIFRRFDTSPKFLFHGYFSLMAFASVLKPSALGSFAKKDNRINSYLK